MEFFIHPTVACMGGVALIAKTVDIIISKRDSFGLW